MDHMKGYYAPFDRVRLTERTQYTRDGVRTLSELCGLDTGKAYFVEDNSGRETVYIELYLDSEYVDEAHGVYIKVETEFPFPGVTVTVSGEGYFDVMLRVPSWASFDAGLGERSDSPTAATSAYSESGEHYKDSEYIKIEHTPNETERFEPGFEYTLRLEYAPDTLDGCRTASLMYGPFVMVTRTPSEEPITLRAEALLRDYFTVSCNREAGAFALIGFGRELVPEYSAHGTHNTYFQIEQ